MQKDGKIETVYFPPYSPEENPQEHVWKNGRALVTNNKFIENIDETANEFKKYLKKTMFHYSFLGLSPVS
ncbi:transposase [Candidatus Azambacteria bacterium]|nr:transposase [Candidatus Azambacteria bacterium]